MIRAIAELLCALAGAALLVPVMRYVLFAVVRVKGRSMVPTLANGERLFYTALDVRLRGVRRGSVVICHFPGRGRTFFVKRCVAVPGDAVYRSDGVTHVAYADNGETVDVALDEGTGYARRKAAHDYPPVILGRNEYFVAGDNRANSHDSRDWKDGGTRGVGPIRGSMIAGRVRWVVWPPGKARAVE